jgi:proline racemase
VKVDVAWGGMFYVLADAASLGLTLAMDQGAALVRAGRKLTQAALEQLPEVVHPTEPSIRGVSICCLTGSVSREDGSEDGEGGGRVRSSNTVVIATGELKWDDPDTFNSGILDRSPCGTGTCARMAILHARGMLPIGTEFEHRSITGATFVGKCESTCTVGGLDAVSPSITGRAWVTGYNTLLLRHDDPFPEGFTVGDVWGAPKLERHENHSS